MYKVNKQLVDSVQRIKKKHKELTNSGFEAKVEREKEYEPILQSLETLRTSATLNPAVKNETKVTPVRPEVQLLKEDKEQLFAMPSTPSIHLQRERSGSFSGFQQNRYSPISPKQFYSSPERPLQKEFENIGDIARQYLLNYYVKPLIVDKTYGLRRVNDSFTLGDSKVNIDENDIIIQDIKYKGTPGLWALLTLKTPTDYSKEDLVTYSKLVKLTNAHRQNYLATGRPLSSTAVKYKQLIKPILDTKEGSGLLRSYKQLPVHPKRKKKKKIEYVYWNDLNELVERYILLCLAEKAGNTSLHNEKESIIAELKEEGVIA